MSSKSLFAAAFIMGIGSVMFLIEYTFSQEGLRLVRPTGILCSLITLALLLAGIFEYCDEKEWEKGEEDKEDEDKP